MNELPPSHADRPSAASCRYPLKLEPLLQERVWGERDLSFLYNSHPPLPRPVGEVWLTADDNRIGNGVWKGATLGELCRTCGAELLGQQIYASRSSDPPAFPLLVKFLFTTDKLSVQVHPPDRYARQREGCAGKTEMWYVLRAEAGARLAIGFREDRLPRQRSREQELDRRTLLAAMESGELEEMLCWMEAQEGDTFYVPAGTIHTSGPGLVLCEIQQNSDITYRLYDYNRPGSDGRPRPLHVEQALEVLQVRTRGGRTVPLARARKQGSYLCLAACPHFVTERLVLENPLQCTTAERFEIWIGLEGEAEFQAAGQRVRCQKGEAVVIPAEARAFSINPLPRGVFLRTFPPALEADIRAPWRAQGFSEQELQGMCFPEPPDISGGIR